MPADSKEYVRKLVQGCIEGNVKSQKELYSTFANKMYAICLRYSGNPDDAKDLLQDGFVKIFNNLSGFEFKGSFEGWMKRIFVNTSIEFLRKRSRMGFTLDVTEVETGGYKDKGFKRLEVQDIMRYINQMPDGYRTVFNLYVIEGYAHREIAEMLDISEGTSKSQLSKARSMMRKLLEEYERH